MAPKAKGFKGARIRARASLNGIENGNGNENGDGNENDFLLDWFVIALLQHFVR